MGLGKGTSQVTKKIILRGVELLAIVMLCAGAMGAQEPIEIYPGNPRLAGAEIEAHSATWRFVVIQNGSETEAGIFEREIDLVDHTADEPALLVRWHVQFPGRSALDIYYLDRETLGQIARYQTGSSGIWSVYQHGDRLRGTYTRRDGEPVVFDAEVPRGVFNRAMLDIIIARLQLEESESVRVPVFNASTQTVNENPVAWITLTVERFETVRLANGEVFETRVVQLSGPGRNQRLWVAGRAPFLLRRDILDDDGTPTAGWRARFAGDLDESESQ